MHRVLKVLSVKGDVTLAPDHVLDRGVHDLMHLDHVGLNVNGDIHSSLI